MDFAQNLQRLMDEQGLSNYQLAKNLDIHPTTVANWLDGKIPRKRTQLLLANYFGVSIDELLGNSSGNNKIPPLLETSSGTDLDEVYFSIAKDAQDCEIDPEDIKAAIQFLKDLKERKGK